MTSQLQEHPLHGVSLKVILTELVDHYGWEILSEQININCFKSNPSIQSSHKFLHKTVWAREKLEAFYLYKFKQYPLPSDEQHAFSPRNRIVNLDRLADSPAEIGLGDAEFFDDPISGPVFPSKKMVQATRTKTKASDESNNMGSEQKSVKSQVGPNKTTVKKAAVDPWSKWRE